MKNILIKATILFLFTTNIYSAESGYILNGKKYIVFKDGKKIGSWPQTTGSGPKNLSNGAFSTRPDSNSAHIYTQTIYYQDDELSRCYYLNTTSAKDNNKDRFSSSISCVRL